MPFTLPDAQLHTLRQLDDTGLLAIYPLSRADCAWLRDHGYLLEDDGWWRITPLGRRALALCDQTDLGEGTLI
jgi:hypothetical protein